MNDQELPPDPTDPPPDGSILKTVILWLALIGGIILAWLWLPR